MCSILDSPRPNRRVRNWFALYSKELLIALAVVVLLLLALGFFQYQAYRLELRNGSITYLNARTGSHYAEWLAQEALEHPRPPAETPGLLPEGTPVSWTVGTDHPAPKAGDVVVNSRGETVMLAETVTEDGVYLGVSQGVDLYGGMRDENGRAVRDGYRGPASARYGASSKDRYVVDEGTGEGRFRSEWEALRSDRDFYPGNIDGPIPQEGLYEGERYFYRVWSVEDAAWYWKGPLFFWFFE